MNLLRYIWKNSLLKVMNYKMAIFTILMLITSRTYVRPIQQLSKALDYPVSWCVFPFVMCCFTYLILFWFGVIYVNSDVPFTHHVNMYHAIRLGRSKWAIGQIVGIAIRSIIIVLLTIICTVIPLMPKIEWTNEWGKLLRTAGITTALSNFDSYVTIYYDIFTKYTPLQLIGIEILICFLTCTFIGVLMFFLSLYFHKICGTIGSLILTIALFPVLNMHPIVRYKLARFIPTVWVEVARITTPDFSYYWLPSLEYMIIFLVINILLMTILILGKVKKMEFVWENDDM